MQQRVPLVRTLMLVAAVAALVAIIIVGARRQRRGMPEHVSPDASPGAPAVNRYPSRFSFEPMRPMSYIPAGEFLMGSNDGNADERPVHRVTLDGFWMDRQEVTHAEFLLFNPEYRRERGSTPLPVEPATQVSWDDAMAFCAWRCTREGVPAGSYRLPTEAEWEYAARGGLVQQPYPWGPSAPAAFDIPQANFDHKDERGAPRDGHAKLAPVGSYLPNGFGLYDMAGNVWEWCLDWYGERAYAGAGTARNPAGPDAGIKRSWRGGGWGSSPDSIRCATRGGLGQGHWLDNLGFRCVRVK
ncbi:formylglycine-generating enzyme family protein [bacterium]|nr:formylglycine-generating enzyme family protein [bacterium]